MGGVVDTVKKVAGGAVGMITGGGLLDSAFGGDTWQGTDPSAIQRNPFNISGGLFGGGSYDPSTGQIRMGAGAGDRFARGALGQASSFMRQVPGAGREADAAYSNVMGQFGSFDPWQAAEDQFSRLDAILEPGRSSARAGTAAGLLSAGRLGSTGGARTQAEVEGEIERQRQSLLSDAWGQAQQTQGNLANLANLFGGLGMQQRAGRQALSLGALQGALNVDAQKQAMLGLGSQISSPAGVSQGQEGLKSQVIGGALSGGASALMSLI